MGTRIRPEMSKKNKYHISKHRYYELKHFCLQYKEMKERYIKLHNEIINNSALVNDKVQTSIISDKTSELAIKMQHISDNISLIERTAYEADPDIGNYIFKAVTEDYSYTYLKNVLGIPCGKDMYYDRYRKYFWLLNGKR